MRILAIDIGTGTQDILLFDSSLTPENCIKLIMPSPTTILAGRVRRATRARVGLVLTGLTMGGGPIAWALEEHLREGLPVFATAEAARTLNDDLEQVARMGIHVVSEDEARSLISKHKHLVLKDLDLEVISSALRAFDVETRYDGLAIALLDHGNAPPTVSDRVFRFAHIRSIIEHARDDANQLLAFAYMPHDLPGYLTRMQAVVRSIGMLDVPIVLLDTGAAAALGALEDPVVRQQDDVVLLNLGNMHALATHLMNGRIVGLFEHHTGFLTTEKLDRYLRDLIAGTLDNTTIFNDMGHGCYIVESADVRARRSRPFLSVTGPRRALARGSRLRPYFAVPHGDMMLAGCFGLIRACAARIPEWSEEITHALAS